jgi:hypothetical protein
MGAPHVIDMVGFSAIRLRSKIKKRATRIRVARPAKEGEIILLLQQFYEIWPLRLWEGVISIRHR